MSSHYLQAFCLESPPWSDVGLEYSNSADSMSSKFLIFVITFPAFDSTINMRKKGSQLCESETIQDSWPQEIVRPPHTLTWTLLTD